MRRALVIQNDIGNRYSPVWIVAAITSKLSPIPYPLNVSVAPTKANGMTLLSAIQLGQVRSVDRSRLVKRLGTLEPAAMQHVNEAIKISLGLVAI